LGFGGGVERAIGVLMSRDVLIIGAGASVPFGVASGLGMMAQISDLLKNELGAWLNVANGKDGSHLPPFLLSRSTCTSEVAESFFAETQWHIEKLERLKGIVDGQTSDTVDDLIRVNGIESEFFKKAIAYCIFERLYALKTEQRRHHSYHLRDIAGREIENIGVEIDKGTPSARHPRRRNWIHHFINLARKHVLEGNVKKIPEIISFNYDGIVEFVLDKKWNNAAHAELGNWRNHFNVRHPHGVMKISDESFDLNAAVAIIVRWSGEIRVVGEASNSSKIDHDFLVQKFRPLVQSAPSVYAAGFSFAKANCELLGIEPSHFGNYAKSQLNRDVKILNFINYDDSYGLRKRAQQYCYDASTNIANSHLIERVPPAGGVLEIDEAIAGGFLGEMPA
jgi:hypothetical protein